MQFKPHPLLLLFFQLVAATAAAQTKTERPGWLFLNAQQKLSSKWSLFADAQVRTTDKFQHVNVILLRPGLMYNITKKQSVALGYTYFGTWEREEGKTAFTPEHRIWEQYQIESSLGKAAITNRLRLEQRFIQGGKDVFAQRLRYQIRNQIPLRPGTNFLKGPYLAAQNELFLNVQNKGKINGKFFDQNRLYGALGYRISKQWDVEAGYMYRYQIEETNNLVSHIVQLTVHADL